MSLNIMIAGCSKDERDRIEAAVRAAFTGRPDEEPWNVSLVNVANQWSIDIDGPEPQFKGLGLVAPTSDLTTSLQKALADADPGGNGAPPAPENGAAPAPVGNEAPSATAGVRKDRHQCGDEAPEAKRGEQADPSRWRGAPPDGHGHARAGRCAERQGQQ